MLLNSFLKLPVFGVSSQLFGFGFESHVNKTLSKKLKSLMVPSLTFGLLRERDPKESPCYD